MKKHVPVSVQRVFYSLRGRFGTVFLEVFSLVETCSLEKTKAYLYAAFEELRGEVEMIKSTDELSILLLNKCHFSNYNILKELVTHLDLADAQEKLSEYEKFRDEKYGKILAEHFAIETTEEYMKDNETQVCCECVFMYYVQ